MMIPPDSAQAQTDALSSAKAKPRPNPQPAAPTAPFANRCLLLYLDGVHGEPWSLRTLLRNQTLPGRLVEAKTRSDFFASLERGQFDLLLLRAKAASDEGVSALELARKKRPEIPIILLADSIEQACSIGCCRRGTADCVHREEIPRLGPAIERVLTAVEDRRERLQAEGELRKLAAFPRLNPTAFFEFAHDGTLTYFNDAALDLARQLGETDPFKIVPADAGGLVRECFADNRPRPSHEIELRGHIISWSFCPIAPINSVHAFAVDVTEQKSLAAQFLRAQRLESIGSLASGIAHDLNNILAPILMSVNLLRETTPPGQNANLLEILRASAQRGADMVRQILSFTRGHDGARTLLQPKHLIAEIAKIARETFPKQIQVRTDASKDLWPVQADSTQIHQVLMNLCVNARDAMPEGGTLTMRARNVSVEENWPERPPEIAPGQFVAIQVEDTGTGIPPEFMEKMWKPFFSSKGQNEGTGLGLSTVASIVKAHQGFVRAESESGKGTRFRVFLPAATTSARAELAESSTSLAFSRYAGQNETILVVDDERAFQEITQAIFIKFGYRVLTASDGTEALALFARHRPIDLVVTDMIMPFLDGLGTITALRRIEPNLPIILTSGLSEHEKASESLGNTKFLLKPFTADKLLAAVRSTLESRLVAP